MQGNVTTLLREPEYMSGFIGFHEFVEFTKDYHVGTCENGAKEIGGCEDLHTHHAYLSSYRLTIISK